MLNLRRLVSALAILTFPVASAWGQCPFCEGEKGTTLVGHFDEALIVLYGKFENPRPGADELEGTTDFIIERVLKSHDAVKNKSKIVVRKEVRNTSAKFLLFCDVYKGRIDSYKGMQLTDGTDMLRYIEGSMRVKDKSTAERLRFAFDYLNNAETDINMDAYREFARTAYRDYKDVAKTLPADKLAAWLEDPKTPPFRYGLYASLLGHCGNKVHAKLLKSMIEDPEKRRGSGLHGLMAAYTMLEPKAGWIYLQDVVQTKKQPFLVRYAALQTIRFLWESRPDLVEKEEIVKGVALVLKVEDMSDFAMEDLRKWKRWEYCDQIVDLFGQKSFNTPIIRKSILRYALQCPNARAVAFVKAQRANDTEWVNDTKELLDMELLISPSAAD